MGLGFEMLSVKDHIGAVAELEILPRGSKAQLRNGIIWTISNDLEGN